MNDLAAAPAASAPATEISNRDKSVIMAGILTSMLLAALDQSIVTPAMPTIGGALGNSEYLPWIVTAYLLTATAVAPLYGKISDIHGRRITLYAALGLFLVGSLIAALAPNMFVLIGARAVQGLGGGGLFALSQILIGDLLPPRERGRYAAWISGMWAVAGIAGPLLGGTFAEHLHWSLIFWINLPLGLVAMIVINKPLKKLTIAARAHKLDGWGAALLILATSALLLMLNWGGSVYSWTSSEILGLGAASAVLWVVFAFRLARAKEPLVSLEILSNPTVLASCFAMFLIAACNIGLAVYLPVYAQSYLGMTPAESGYSLLGFLIGTVVSAAISGRLTMRVVHVKRIAVVGAALGALGLVALGALAGQTSVIVLELVLIVIGLGMGLTFPVNTVSVQNAVDQRHLGVATGMFTFLRSLGSALGVAVLGTIALGYGVPLGAEVGGVVNRVSDAFPFSVIFWTMAAMMLGGAILDAVMPHVPLRGRPEPAMAE